MKVNPKAKLDTKQVKDRRDSTNPKKGMAQRLEQVVREKNTVENQKKRKEYWESAPERRRKAEETARSRPSQANPKPAGKPTAAAQKKLDEQFRKAKDKQLAKKTEPARRQAVTKAKATGKSQKHQI